MYSFLKAFLVLMKQEITHYNCFNVKHETLYS